MAIVSSVIAETWTQPNGAVHVLERHTDSDGVAHDRFSVNNAGTDVNALLALHAQQLADDLARREIEELLR